MTQQSQKPKVDVAAIMQKAKAKTSEVKKSTTVLNSKTEDYRTIPGFSKYEINSENCIRNKKSKEVVTVTGGKLRMMNDAGERKFHSIDKIRIEIPLPAKAEKTKEVKERVKKVEIECNVKKDDLVKFTIKKEEKEGKVLRVYQSFHNAAKNIAVVLCGEKKHEVYTTKLALA